MEIYRRITGQKKQVEEGVYKASLFQKNCQGLAGSLFEVLRKYDPWCIWVEFEGPLPLNPDSPNVSGYISASIQDVVEGDPMVPYIRYTGFEITVPDKEKKGEPLQRVTLHNWWDYNNKWWHWELQTHEKEVWRTILPHLGQESPLEEFEKISKNIYHKWDYKPTKR